jgi:hypothetical protein
MISCLQLGIYLACVHVRPACKTRPLRGGLLWLQLVKQADNGDFDKGFYKNQKRQWIDTVFSFSGEEIT